ncbi:hypothetical protein FGO68_gene10461 [Halteria grandinella]|uniref:Uncharacterized protein n=1 Tax=Halteria grandinella TaxID=5974 RepID=A0A8J8T2U1_HALGN|nr:hypothetical protein FGO68_gene10461 [Halteria grandinella]
MDLKVEEFKKLIAEVELKNEGDRQRVKDLFSEIMHQRPKKDPIESQQLIESKPTDDTRAQIEPHIQVNAQPNPTGSNQYQTITVILVIFLISMLPLFLSDTVSTENPNLSLENSQRMKNSPFSSFGFKPTSQSASGTIDSQLDKKEFMITQQPKVSNKVFPSHFFDWAYAFNSSSRNMSIQSFANRGARLEFTLADRGLGELRDMINLRDQFALIWEQGITSIKYKPEKVLEKWFKGFHEGEGVIRGEFQKCKGVKERMYCLGDDGVLGQANFSSNSISQVNDNRFRDFTIDDEKVYGLILTDDQSAEIRIQEFNISTNNFQKQLIFSVPIPEMSRNISCLGVFTSKNTPYLTLFNPLLNSLMILHPTYTSQISYIPFKYHQGKCLSIQHMDTFRGTLAQLLMLTEKSVTLIDPVQMKARDLSNLYHSKSRSYVSSGFQYYFQNSGKSLDKGNIKIRAYYQEAEKTEAFLSEVIEIFGILSN